MMECGCRGGRFWGHRQAVLFIQAYLSLHTFTAKSLTLYFGAADVGLVLGPLRGYAKHCSKYFTTAVVQITDGTATQHTFNDTTTPLSVVLVRTLELLSNLLQLTSRDSGASFHVITASQFGPVHHSSHHPRWFCPCQARGITASH